MAVPLGLVTRYAQSAGILSSAALQYLIVIITFNLGDLEMVGSYSLSQAVAMPVFAFFAFSLRPLWVAGLFGNRSFIRMLCLRGVMTIVSVLAITLVVEVWDVVIPLWLFAFVVYTKALDNLSDIAFGALDKGSRSATAGLCLFTKSAALASLLGLSWFSNLSLYETYLAFSVAQTVIFAGEIWLAKGAIPGIQLTAAVTPPLALSLFSALNSLVASILGYIPRYGLEAYVGREAVGYFSLVFIPVSMISMISTGVAQSNLQDISVLIRQGTIEALRSKINSISVLIITTNVLLACFFGALTLFAIKTSLVDAYLMKHMMWATLLTVPAALLQLSSYVAMASGGLGRIFALSCGALVFQAGLTPLVVSSWGLWGAIVLYAVSGALQTLGFVEMIRRSYMRD